MTDAEKYLGRPEKIYRQLQLIELQIKEQRLMLFDLGSFDYSQDRVMSSGASGASYESRLELIERLEADYIFLRTEYREIQAEMYRDMKHLLNPKERKYVRLRWLDFEGNVYISQQMNFRSRNTARNYEKRIIQKFERWINEQS